MSRQPLTSRAAAVAVVGLVVVALAHAGIAIPADIREAVVEVIAVGGPLVAAFWTRRHVTPTASPRAADGTPLVPAPPTLVPAPATAVADATSDDAPVATEADDELDPPA
ncbi:hypothetical protein [Krasilnikovia sp. MM14-A1259]|uniref:hypothetical protein n=1 Tax=Krasilnikovia sp. MM14-A1259 TaxID=3373539 RepID=UPI00399D2D79